MQVGNVENHAWNVQPMQESAQLPAQFWRAAATQRMPDSVSCKALPSAAAAVALLAKE